MKKEDTTAKIQTDEWPHEVTAANNAFEHAFALYRSRVHEYVHSLLMGGFSDENEETNTDTY